jgi:XTP/dITP diphosphohydrolase
LLASGAGRVVVLATSARVAPGLLTARAWDTLRAARRVLTGLPDHPQLAALTEAGIDCQVVPGLDPQSVARLLHEEAAAAAGSIVWLPGPDGWLAAPGGEEATGPLLAALAALGEQPGSSPEIELLPGTRDLPGARLLDLVATMDTLRVNCPWDAKQTHETLAPHLIEESYEALEALEDGDQAALREELGDVLLQVAFHARVAAERADGTGYAIDDVADGIVAKLVRRHPHVFGEVEVSGADEVKQNWDAIKAAERTSADGVPGSALDGVPFGQPALALAAQLQRRAERAGVPGSVREEAPSPGEGPGEGPGEQAAARGADLGAELFRLVTRARAAGLDPELELRAASRRYRDRVRAWERSRPLG